LAQVGTAARLLTAHAGLAFPQSAPGDGMQGKVGGGGGRQAATPPAAAGLGAARLPRALRLRPLQQGCGSMAALSDPCGQSSGLGARTSR
jgi:hypothetical protein